MEEAFMNNHISRKQENVRKEVCYRKMAIRDQAILHTRCYTLQQWPLFVPCKPKQKVKIGSSSIESSQILLFIASNNNNTFKIQMIS